MQSEMKPCPFCGCEKILDGYVRDGREIVCGECRASVAAFHPDASKRAAERWNRRAEPALSAAEPVAWRYSFKGGKWTVQKNKPNWFKEGMPDVEIEPLFIASSTQQPAPSVAVKAEQTKCKNCGGTLNSWFASNRVNSVALDGRLKSNEISCDFVLGCDECSETLRVVPADVIASQMNAVLSAQVQDVAQERYRHKKRGSIYTVMARGRLQVDGDLDNEKVVVYRGEDGQTWVRPEYEFNDGRFEPLPAAPAKQEGGHD